MPLNIRLYLKTLLAALAVFSCHVTVFADTPSVHWQWGNTNFVARGGWARMIHLADHTWLSVNTQFAQKESVLQIRTCPTLPGSWKLIAEIREAGRLMDNGELIQLPDGGILLTGRSLIQGESYRLPVYRSGDGGTNWSAMGNIDSNEGPPGTLNQRGLWEPHFFLLPDSRLAVAYANEKLAADQPAFSQVCSERISSDQGKTWGDEIILAAGSKSNLRPGMPVVCRMTNGKFIAVYEVVGIGDADVFCKVSADGIHWPEGLGTRIAGQHAGPWVTSLANGQLLLTSCSNQLVSSDDFGITWHATGSPAWDLGPGKNFSWPAIYETNTNQIAVMISWHGVKIRSGHPAP